MATYNEIKARALKNFSEFDTVYDYGTAYVFFASKYADEDGGGGTPWAYMKDSRDYMPFHLFIDTLDFDPNQVDEDHPLGKMLDFETGSTLE